MPKTPNKQQMTLAEVKRLTIAEINKHLENEWEFKWSTAKSFIGQCRWNRVSRDGQIKISKTFVKGGLPKEEILDTIKHEVAHALDVERRGTSDHGPKWKRCCRETGANPNRTCDLPSHVKQYLNNIAKWVRYCPNCDNKRYLHRKPTATRACGNCCRKHNGGKFSYDYVLKVKRNN